MLIQQESITFHKLDSRDFLEIANGVLKKGKSAIPTLFGNPEMLSSASDKAELFADNFSKNSNFDNYHIFLLAFPYWTSLKLHNVTSNLVRKVITNINLSNTCYHDCIPWVVLKNCESQLYT